MPLRILCDLCDLLHGVYLSVRLMWNWPKVSLEDQWDVEDSWDLVDMRY